ncbi:MAG: NAD-dependent epimerase/dehydratase family protein [Solirubrobacteraceae bacterium]
MPDRWQKVLVIGAQGALGRLCADALRASGFDVVRAGRRAESAPDFRLLDLDDSAAVERCCADADLIVSTARHKHYAAERFALREGKTLISVASFRLAELYELALLEPNPAGRVILNAGLAPGVSSLVLKELLEEHPEADGVESTATYSLMEPGGRGVAEDALPLWRGAHRLPTKVLDFPEPFGRARCLRFVGDEAIIGLFGRLAAGRDARAYVYLLERPGRMGMLALNAVGLLTRMPAGFFGFGYQWRRAITTAKPQFHIVALWLGERRIAARSITGSGNYVMSAQAVAAFSEAVLEGPGMSAKPTGLLNIEDAFDLSEVRQGLEKRGLGIRVM